MVDIGTGVSFPGGCTCLVITLACTVRITYQIVGHYILSAGSLLIGPDTEIVVSQLFEVSSTGDVFLLHAESDGSLTTLGCFRTVDQFIAAAARQNDSGCCQNH